MSEHLAQLLTSGDIPQVAGRVLNLAELDLQTGNRQAATDGLERAILSNVDEGQERQAVLTDLRDQDRVLELGSGIGAMAMWIKQAKPAIPVTTVKANPDLAAVIRRNCALNHCDATLIEGVAALTDGEVALHLADEFWASSTYNLAETRQAIQRQSVDVNRLIDELRPTILIMDVEGGEVDLVPHLRLDGIRRLIIEMHPDATPAASYSRVFKVLLDAGFEIDRTLSRAEVFVFGRPD